MKEKRQKNLKYLLTVSLIIICTGINFRANNFVSNSVDDYWFNIPSCPLKINVKESAFLMNESLENVSKGQITGYQLGCVSEKNDSFEIISESRGESIEINSSDSKSGENILYLPKGSHGTYLQIGCISPAKVAVIKVNFADGDVWTVKK